MTKTIHKEIGRRISRIAAIQADRFLDHLEKKILEPRKSQRHQSTIEIGRRIHTTQELASKHLVNVFLGDLLIRIEEDTIKIEEETRKLFKVRLRENGKNLGIVETLPRRHRGKQRSISFEIVHPEKLKDFKKIFEQLAQQEEGKALLFHYDGKTPIVLEYLVNKLILDGKIPFPWFVYWGKNGRKNPLAFDGKTIFEWDQIEFITPEFFNQYLRSRTYGTVHI